MAETRPHITVGHHDRYGVVAATSHDNHVAEHILRLVGFERLSGSTLYGLTDPHRDPVRRAAQAVQSLRAAQYSVTSDVAYDLQPRTRLGANRGLLDRLEKPSVSTVPTVERAVVASARVLDADIKNGWIVVHDQVRDPEGALRAVGTDTRTREGVLLHGEGDHRYVETRLASTDLAFDAFSYIRGNGRPDPTPSTQQRRAHATTTVSPARAGVPLARHLTVAVEYRPALSAPQPVRTR
ncbi:hypothetical protein ACF08B_28560 [Streptomyces sp. NPDC015139]|uniref:hypothetical protein n=1 Tax=Streptomyces sp. NPDC015139 TaxID=3364942 RepID=UPI0037012803